MAEGRPPRRGPPLALASPPPVPNMKVVIFDDELFQRRAAFSVEGATLAFYEHADDAVAVVAAEVPDLVLMDFSMSALRSGADAVAALREVLPELPIVAISSSPDSNERMLAAGADDAAPKTHLRAYLGLWIERRREAVRR